MGHGASQERGRRLRREGDSRPALGCRHTEAGEEDPVGTSRLLLAKRVAKNKFGVERPSFILVCSLCRDLPRGDVQQYTGVSNYSIGAQISERSALSAKPPGTFFFRGSEPGASYRNQASIEYPPPAPQQSPAVCPPEAKLIHANLKTPKFVKV